MLLPLIQEMTWTQVFVVRFGWNLASEDMDGLVCAMTEEQRLEASLVAICDIVGMLNPFIISLFFKNQGIGSAPKGGRLAVDYASTC